MTLRLSWSAAGYYMSCPRKYQLAYIEGLIKPTSADGLTPVIGSHVHAGWEAAVKSRFQHPNARVSSLITDAVYGVRNYRIKNLDTERQVYDWDKGEYVLDTGYLEMMDSAFETARAILEYQIPRFDWERFIPVTLADLYGDAAEHVLPFFTSVKRLDAPLAEVKFDIPVKFEEDEIETPLNLVGVVDAIMFDKQQNEYVLIDWKTRREIVDPMLVAMDGQLPLYAAVINALAGESRIRRGIMYQISMSIPNPVKLTPKGGKISMAAPGSTWEVWSASVRALGEDPEQYREQMYEKMQDPSHYTAPVEVAFNMDVDQRTFENLEELTNSIQQATDAGTFPGILSTNGCKYCQFKRLCYTFQGGGDPNVVIQKEFIINKRILDAETSE